MKSPARLMPRSPEVASEPAACRTTEPALQGAVPADPALSLTHGSVDRAGSAAEGVLDSRARHGPPVRRASSMFTRRSFASRSPARPTGTTLGLRRVAVGDDGYELESPIVSTRRLEPRWVVGERFPDVSPGKVSRVTELRLGPKTGDGCRGTGRVETERQEPYVRRSGRIAPRSRLHHVACPEGAGGAGTASSAASSVPAMSRRDPSASAASYASPPRAPAAAAWSSSRIGW